MTITNASEEMKRSYVNIIKDYNMVEKIAPKEKLNYDQERLNDDENKKVNEIFEQFEDDEPTFHQVLGICFSKADTAIIRRKSQESSVG